MIQEPILSDDAAPTKIETPTRKRRPSGQPKFGGIGSVRYYLETQFFTDQTVQEIQRKYRETIRFLCRWKSRSVRLDELCNVMLSQFTRWLKSLGTTEDAAGQHRRRLLTVWEHYEKSLQSPKNETTGNVSLFFKWSYCTAKPDLSRITIGQYEGALRDLEEFHGGPVDLSDLTEEFFDKFKAWLIAGGHRESTAIGRVYNIKAICNHAAKPAPVRSPRKSRKPQIVETIDTPAAEQNSSSGLNDYFEQVFLPTRKDLQARYLEYCRATLKHFHVFHGGPVALADLSEPYLLMFADSLRSDGKSESTIEAKVRILSAIMRHSNPKAESAKPTESSSKKPTGPNTGILEYFESKYVLLNPNISANSIEQYRVNLRMFEKWNTRPVKLRELSPELVTKFIVWVRSEGKSERTANNKRQAILTVWRHAARKKYVAMPDTVAKISEPDRIVEAWTVDQIRRILDACDSTEPMTSRDGRYWDRRHWRALVLTIYDTSHRIGALLQVTKTAVRSDGSLFANAVWTKQKSDTIHQLHPDTVAALAELPKSESPLLFPWPMRKRAIFAYFKAILKAAKLPTTRKDLFHKIRRTSFTYVYALLGPQAARDQAGHATDLTSAYLDKRICANLQNRPLAISVLPRPEASSLQN